MCYHCHNSSISSSDFFFFLQVWCHTFLFLETPAVMILSKEIEWGLGHSCRGPALCLHRKQQAVKSPNDDSFLAFLACGNVPRVQWGKVWLPASLSIFQTFSKETRCWSRTSAVASYTWWHRAASHVGLLGLLVPRGSGSMKLWNVVVQGRLIYFASQLVVLKLCLSPGYGLPCALQDMDALYPMCYLPYPSSPELLEASWPQLWGDPQGGGLCVH